MNNQFTSINIEPQESTSSNPINNIAQDDRKIKNLQAQVNEVSNIMEENIKRIVERGTRLEHLENRSDLMQSRSDQFRIHAKQVRKKAWWANQKMNLLYIVLLIIVGVAVYFTVFN